MENNNISISRDVLATIVSVATNEVEGVAGIANTLGNSVSQIFKKKNLLNGMNIDVNEETNEIAIEVFVSIKFGYELKGIAGKVQEKIKSAIESMTSLVPSEIIVNIANIVENPKGE